MISQSIKNLYFRLLQPLVRLLGRSGISPHALTVVGFIISLGAAVCFGYGYFCWAGSLTLLAGVFDTLDGQLARMTDQTTRFGAFFDSTLDRFSETAVLLGLMFFFITRQSSLALLVAVFIAASLMVSYTKARAEGLGQECTIGLMQRPERVMLLGIAAFFNLQVLIIILWILTILTGYTVGERIMYISKRLMAK